MWHGSRRDFLRAGGAAIAGAALGSTAIRAIAQEDASHAEPEVEVLFPRHRVPLSFIIDDSTCLVNMGHFCTPQFGAAFPGARATSGPGRPGRGKSRYVRPRVRRSGAPTAAWKGKYSVVPNPACVGWLDRELPGWSRAELQESLKLVRELLVPNWDIHPEMITHTRVIDLKTGRPFEEFGPAAIENSYPQRRRASTSWPPTSPTPFGS